LNRLFTILFEQGMLRKTNYTRGSMKRNEGDMVNTKMWESQEVDKGNKGPSYSAVLKNKRQHGPSKGGNSRRHELAPGVIVEGEVADL
jgi:hypothetical protein